MKSPCHNFPHSTQTDYSGHIMLIDGHRIRGRLNFPLAGETNICGVTLTITTLSVHSFSFLIICAFFPLNGFIIEDKHSKLVPNYLYILYFSKQSALNI